MRRESAQAGLRSGGMTLIELLVSLGVLAVICVAFATIMSQTHSVVDRSNALMRRTPPPQPSHRSSATTWPPCALRRI